jgi:spore maturation protein SpmB
MCTFLAINTSSVQLIPATAVAILATAGATQPTVIIGSAFLATLVSTTVALIVVKTLEKWPRYALPLPSDERRQEVEQSLCEEEAEEAAAKAERISGFKRLLLWAFLAAWLALAVHLVIRETQGGAGVLSAVVQTLSLLAVPALFAFFPVFAALKKVPVYEEFVEGAKEGVQVALRIIPFLVAILAAIAIFRAAGGVELLARALAPLLALLGVPVDVLPLMMVRPLSGSGALGIFSEIVQTHGGDSFAARLAGTILGSTETTFYVLAVYFGSVAVRRTRHAVPAGLAADLCGMLAAIFIARWLFL